MRSSFCPSIDNSFRGAGSRLLPPGGPCMSRVVLSHPTGNANVRAVLAALDGENLLDTFYTTVGVRSGSFVQRSIPPPFRGRTQRRAYGVEHGRIVYHPLREMLRL